MPQAAFADSTTAPTDHHFFSVAPDELDDIHAMLTCLGESACLAIENKNPPLEYASGLSALFEMSLERLQIVRLKIRDHRPRPEPIEQPRTTVFERKHLPDDPWIEVKLFWRVVEIIKAVRQENGEPVFERDEDWPEPLLTTVKNLAKSYVEKVKEKVEDCNDALEVGSHLPWIESIIRSDLLRKPQSAAVGLRDLWQRLPPSDTPRDQFVSQAHAEGFSVADIALELGTEPAVVERVIRRLTDKAAGKNVRTDEAKAG